MAEPKRCLVVGLGQIGMGYDFDVGPDGGVYTHARAISLHPNFELVGGVDPVDQQRSRFEAKYGRKAFNSIAEAMQALRPQVVVIATPAAMHLLHVEAALAVHPPEVLICEKPLALDAAAGEALVKRCDDVGTLLFVNYIRRSEPGAIEVRRRVDSGEIGTPIKGSFWYSKGLFNNGSHFINLLQFWLGEVKGHTVLRQGRRWEDVDPEPDVHIDFERGSVVMQAAWEESFSYYDGELLSPSGRLSYRDGGGQIGWQGVKGNSNFSGYNVLATEVENVNTDMDRYQWHVYQQLSQCLAGKACQLCSGREALATLSVVAAITG